MISERWPLIAQEITVAEEIEYDNLYLDMNSILHNCSHSNDGEISRLTDEQIFGAIFAYIDYLFNLIKPKKVFYMAIDGVAPRAKMNQQRARRFRSAVEAEEMLKKAIESGEPIPKDPAFDTNAITPGTEFMAKVTENLKFYINQKVSNDKQWQDIEIILSGHEVPGEGEHKIMEYIRVQKAQDTYNPNTRHCVYGLDADLIVLGLVAHEPHFSLLREEVTFGRNQKHSTDVSNQTFFLLHISLVRDYLREEFESLSDEISFEYDFERILDDFVLILYVIGNDFLPNLPDLHLNKGAFPLLLHTFKEAMRRTDGYLNEKGQINLKRLAIWLDILSIFELENFEEGAIDVEWFNKQLDNVSRRGERVRERQGKELIMKQQKRMVGLLSKWLNNVYKNEYDIKLFLEDEAKIPEKSLPRDFFESELNVEFIKKLALELGLFIVHHQSTDEYTVRLDVDGVNPDESEEEFKERATEARNILRKYEHSVVIEDEDTLHSEEGLYNEKFTNWKDSYYKEKLGFSINDEEELVKMTENYIEGLQWVLNYYYKGNCSWPWYYKYHYAPRISDLSNGLNVKFHFEIGQPFKPFEQLMSVLPARSKELIPVCYRHLMTDEDSPIIDFYPDDCAIDKNGKTASWEAVVLLSFVDEHRLKEAMAPLNSKLTLDERKRNSFGNDLIYNFNPQLKTLIKSPLPSVFPDFESHATESLFVPPSMEGKSFVFGLAKDVRTGIHMLAGFPTLDTIPHASELRKDQLVVFQQPTRSESMILTLENEFENITPEQFAKLYCNKIIFANWPYLREYQVVHVTDGLMKYEISKSSNYTKIMKSPLENFEISEYNKNVDDINYFMHVKKGLRFSTRDISDEIITDKKKSGAAKEPIDGLVYGKRVVGVTPNSKGKLVKVFSDKIECFPMQLIVPQIESVDSRFEEKEPVPIEEEYPVGTPVIFLGKTGYGTSASVVATDKEKNTLAIQYAKPNTAEPLFGLEAAKVEHDNIIYRSAFEASKILHISTFFLSKITSTYMIYEKERKINVGLSLKFEGKGIKTLGYTRKNGRSWEYSDIAIGLIREYLRTFPQLMQALLKYKGNSMPKARDLFSNLEEDDISGMLRDVKDYLMNKKNNFTQVSLSSDSLSKISIGKIEEQIIGYNQVPHAVTLGSIKNIPRFAVLNPNVPVLKLKQQQFRLGDRVVYVLGSGKVPLFSKGTVIGYRSSETSVSAHVLFDAPVLTGNTFEGRLKTQRGLSVDSSSLLNITLKQFVYLPKGAQSKMPSRDKPPAAKSKTAKPAAIASKPTKIIKAPMSQKEKEEAAEKARAAKLKEESTKELLSLISGKNDDKEKSEMKSSTEQEKEQSLPAASANGGTTNLLNKLVNNVLASTESKDGVPPFNNGAPPGMNGFIPPYPPMGAGGFPPMNGFLPPFAQGYPMPPPQFMYPYSQQVGQFPVPPFPVPGPYGAAPMGAFPPAPTQGQTPAASTVAGGVEQVTSTLKQTSIGAQNSESNGAAKEGNGHDNRGGHRDGHRGGNRGRRGRGGQRGGRSA